MEATKHYAIIQFGENNWHKVEYWFQDDQTGVVVDNPDLIWGRAFGIELQWKLLSKAPRGKGYYYSFINQMGEWVQEAVFRLKEQLNLNDKV